MRLTFSFRLGHTLFHARRIAKRTAGHRSWASRRSTDSPGREGRLHDPARPTPLPRACPTDWPIDPISRVCSRSLAGLAGVCGGGPQIKTARPVDRLAPLFALATPPLTGHQHPVSHPAGLCAKEPRLESPVALHETDRGRLAAVPRLPLTSLRDRRRSCPLPRNRLQGRWLAGARADLRVSQVQYALWSA